MSKKDFTRRKFIRKTLSGAAVFSAMPPLEGVSQHSHDLPSALQSGTTDSFTEQLREVLPDEALYDYHKKLSADPVHILRRDQDGSREEGEMSIADQGWSIIFHPDCTPLIRHAIDDFCDYLSISQQVDVTAQENGDVSSWKSVKKAIVAATATELPAFQKDLKGSKDYIISVSEDQIIVCGYDDRGTMFGLYNLEARMNLREGPYLPKNLFTIRHSHYQTRMVLSWMGWMEWPDRLLSHLVHDGFDGIFAAVYTNPTGDRTTAETSTDFYARILYKARQQDPAVVRDLIDRAARFGLKVYTPIIYQFMGTEESKTGLRKLVRSILEQFPDIKGYILLTEGFWYQAWGGGHGADESYMQNWAENWSEAVSIVEEECHRIDPSIEIIPWEYNIDFRPKNRAIKKYFIQQLPQEAIPMLTWENGKSYQIDGMQCYLRDYSLNQIGPAEVTSTQIEEADKRGMQVYSKVDTFASWQFGTIPYLPCPQQWFDRYTALERHDVAGTLESWSSGYKPNFISEMRAWTCWSDAPDRDDLLTAMAARLFGQEQKQKVIQAWNHFSEAIRLVPDTGPNMGTNHAVANPLFFQEPPARTATFQYSWSDQKRYLPLNPYWPYTVSRMVFYPDFSNQVNLAEKYARSATGIEVDQSFKVLPVFLKYLALAAEKMEEGLSLYRQAAQDCPAHKQAGAFKEVVVAEQLQRMMQSDHAVLEFEDLRLQLTQITDHNKAGNILDNLEKILDSEVVRTEKSLLAAQKDTRLGFQFEQDYVYTPYSLQEKINLLKLTREEHIPAYRQGLKSD